LTRSGPFMVTLWQEAAKTGSENHTKIKGVQAYH
jgi:hypothetical protein